MKLEWPVYRTAVITQRFGENPADYPKTKGHNGLDFGIPLGTPVYAAAAGTVTRADMDSTGYGLHVRIQHKHPDSEVDDCLTLYGHLQSLAVKAGQSVKAGQVIGESGNTGNSTGPHLHFEIRKVATNFLTCVDPLVYLIMSEDVKYHGVVTDDGDKLRVRSAPTLTAEVKRYLPAGTPVDLVEIRGDWGRLLDAGERWVCLRLNGVEFVRLTGASGEPETPAALSDAEKLKRLWAAHPELHQG